MNTHTLPSRVPTLLVVLIEVKLQRWSAAAVEQSGQLTPLVQSEVGDLGRYVGAAQDEQLSFLRHRLCGVLQRANDRLFARNLKASEIALVCDGPLEPQNNELTQRLADHFVEWLSRPPVAFFVVHPAHLNESLELECLAGECSMATDRLTSTVQGLFEVVQDRERWELIPRKP